MSIADAQARALIPMALRRMAETVENPRIQMPFERSEGSITMLAADKPIIEAGTGRRFYHLVYVVLAETRQQIEERVEQLLPPGAK